MNQVEEIRYLILAVQREGSRMLTSALRPLELTPSQSEVLRVLQDHEPLSLAELGTLLVCEAGSPSRMVNRLVQTGFVEQKKSAADSRKVVLTLTEKGRKATSSIVAIEEKMYASMQSLLKGAPVPELIDLLWRFAENTPSGKALTLRKGQNPRT